MLHKTGIDDYLTRASSVPRPDLDERLNHLHRVTTRKKQWENLCIFAFDHRKQMVEMANKVGANIERLPNLKQLLLKAMEQTAKLAGLPQDQAGILADTRVLNNITGKHYWIARPIEEPSSRPLELEYGDLGTQLSSFPK